MKCSFPLVFRLLFFAVFASGIPLSPLFTEDASGVMTDNQPAAIQSRATPRGTATYDTDKVDCLVYDSEELQLFEFPRQNALNPDYGSMIKYARQRQEKQRESLNILIFPFGSSGEIDTMVYKMESEVRYYFKSFGYTIKTFNRLPSMATEHHLKHGDQIPISVKISKKEPVVQFVVGDTPYNLNSP